MKQVSVTWRNREVVWEGLRDGNVIAWLETASTLKTAEGYCAQRHFLLLDPGIKMAIPNIWVERGDPVWYVDLVSWAQTDDRYDLTDMDIDLFVPTDGRPYRTVDFDEFADAIEAGEFTLAQATDAMRRWQTFLDTYVHQFGPGDVNPGWKDFPPLQIARLQNLEDRDFPGSIGKDTR